jgi:hypothetical protein
VNERSRAWRPESAAGVSDDPQRELPVCADAPSEFRICRTGINLSSASEAGDRTVARLSI